MRVTAIMNRQVVVVKRGTTLAAAARLMLKHNINSLPVLDESDHLVGMVGIRDVLRVPVPSNSDMPILKWARLEDKAVQLERTTVDHVMARQVVSVNEEARVIDAAALMANRGLHPIPVLRDGRLVGVVSRADVVKALLDLLGTDASQNQSA